MTLSTAKLQAQHASGRARTQDYLEWAIDFLASGSDSPNLRILAGLDALASPFEAGEHFVKTRKELGLPAPDDQEALRDYAILLAENLLEPGSDYEAFVAVLAELCHSNDHPAFLSEWYWLEDGLSALRDGAYPYAFEALHQADPRTIVAGVAQSFLAQEKIASGPPVPAPPHGPQ